ncbi:major facilitator superfamily domain-containing protein [Chytriomyces sp. MP71]|nr:major facilitator superfamily domain-containing protein [Chytriomyces sp. MP71]
MHGIPPTCAGTLYLFSAYAQSLQTKRGLSQTALNWIASTGGIGQYLSGPVWGRLSDQSDRRRLCAIAGILLFTGYASLAWGYDSPNIPVPVLALAYACVGLGSSGIFNSVLATSVKNYSERDHGFAVGVPVAFFGLSAFLFSQLQRAFVSVEGGLDVFGFLLFVGSVAGGGAMVGSVFLHDCSAALIRREHESGVANSERSDAESQDEEAVSAGISPPPGIPAIHTSESSPLVPTPTSHASTFIADANNTSLFQNRDAWLLFLSFILLSGTGLMYINNVGAILIALLPASTPPATLQNAQRLHVSLLSICNCFGRVATGLGSDVLMSRFKLTRLVGLVSGGVLIALALVGGLAVRGADGLVPVTLALGVGYGAIFSSAPAIVSRWFGVEQFGANWGWFQWAPAMGGQLCNLVFGMLLDRAKRGEVQCRAGVACFGDAFSVFLIGVLGSLGMLLVLNGARGGWIVRRAADV